MTNLHELSIPQLIDEKNKIICDNVKLGDQNTGYYRKLIFIDKLIEKLKNK